MEYLDFDLELSMVGETICRVRATSPHWGNTSAKVDFDPSDPELARVQYRLAAGRIDRRSLQDFGATLFETLFPRDVAIAFGASIGDARAHGKGLRIRLALEAGPLRTIPWEYAYFPLRHQFLGVDVATPITRHLDTFGETMTPPVETSLRVLIVAPTVAGLDIETEIGHIRDAFEPIDAFVEHDLLERDRPVTWDRLCERLTLRPPHILHFIGHGSFSDGRGLLYFNDERGGLRPEPGERLAAELRNTSPIRLVVLNSCVGAAACPETDDLSGVAQQLVGAGVPAVLAHRYPIKDDHAIELTKTFYSSLVSSAEAGLVEAAVTRARSRLNAAEPGDPIIGTSVLYVRLTGPVFRLVAPDDDTLTLLEAELSSVQQALRYRREECASGTPTQTRRDRLAEAERAVELAKAALDRARRQRVAARDAVQRGARW